MRDILARRGNSADNPRMSRRMGVVLVGFAASMQLGCRESIEHKFARTTLANVCDAYTKAEQQFPDPARAYENVRDHYVTFWPPLRKARAGLEGVEPSIRYALWLRFARNDYEVADWTCPALDRLLLHEIDRRAKVHPPEPPPSDYRRAVIRVTGSGEVFIDNEVVALGSVKATVRQLNEQPRVLIDLYREGWPSRMHPSADAVISDVIAERASFGVCTQPDCRY
jgi:hypothetical protein